MEKFKNFLYDKNDIIVALVIIVLATFIITGRINAIMAYPETMLTKAQEEAGNSILDNDPASPEITTPAVPDESEPVVEEPVETPPVVEQPDTTIPVTNPPPAGGTVITITVPTGSTGEAIAAILVTNGLIVQKSDFTTVVNASGLGTKLKAGTFKIPAGSTPAEIVAIIAK